MAVASEVIVRLIGKTKKFEGDMRRSSKVVEGVGKSSATASAGLLKMVGPLAAVATGAGAATFAFSKLTSTFQGIDRITKVSTKLGITTTELTKLQHAAEMTGASANLVNTALQRMVRRGSEANAGIGATAAALKELQIDAGKFFSLTPDKQFRRLAKAMESVKNHSDRLRLTIALFDTEGAELVNTLALGEAGLDKMGAQAVSLGKTFDNLSGEKVGSAIDAMARLESSWDGAWTRMAIQIAPVVEGVATLIEMLHLADIASLNLFSKGAGKGGAARAMAAFNPSRGPNPPTNPGAPPAISRLAIATAANLKLTKNTTDALWDMTAALRDQIWFFGKGADAAQLYHLQLAARDINDPAKRKEALRLVQEIKRRQEVVLQLDKEKQAKQKLAEASKFAADMAVREAKMQKATQKAFADSLFRQTRTPMERVVAELEKIQQARDRGDITKDVFDRASRNAFQTFPGQQMRLASSPAALERGTAAAFTAVNQSKRQNVADKLLEAQLKQMQEDALIQAKLLKVAQDTNKKLEPASISR